MRALVSTKIGGPDTLVMADLQTRCRRTMKS
jgi:hypothetical protein